MTGLGTIINGTAIIAGGVVGSMLKGGIPERFKETVMQAVGLSVLLIGVSGALQGLYRVNSAGKIEMHSIMLTILSLVIGAVAGEALNIENALEKTGQLVERRLNRGNGQFTEGFVTASLVFCVGAMAIMGSLEEGLTGNPSTLVAKAVLDGVIAVILSAALGIGVGFSFIPVVIYQGAITISAGLIRPLLTEAVITQTSLVGSVLIIAIGLNMLEVKRIKVGNLLPAIFVPLVYYLITLLIYQ